MITVAKDNSGDFDSIQKAVDSVSDNNNETIFIKKGIYKERIEIRKNNITLIGEDTDETIITEGFYARMIMLTALSVELSVPIHFLYMPIISLQAI